MNTVLIRSKAAVARLRAYKPPAFPLWDRLPASRRAAVLLLLYADRHGDLRVVITMRAATLRHFSGNCESAGPSTHARLWLILPRPCGIARRQGR
jgi:peroxisomal coenzyme A diphosphatase NUDT7